MIRYPESMCEIHKGVKTSEPVCIVCMSNKIDRLKEVNAELLEALEALSALGALEHSFDESTDARDAKIKARAAIAKAKVEAAYIIRAAAEESDPYCPAVQDAYERALEELMIVNCMEPLTTGDAKSDLFRLIACEVQIALDPRVSEAARTLMADGASKTAELLKALKAIAAKYDNMPAKEEYEVYSIASAAIAKVEEVGR